MKLFKHLAIFAALLSMSGCISYRYVTRSYTASGQLRYQSSLTFNDATFIFSMLHAQRSFVLYLEDTTTGSQSLNATRPIQPGRPTQPREPKAPPAAPAPDKLIEHEYQNGNHITSFRQNLAKPTQPIAPTPPTAPVAPTKPIEPTPPRQAIPNNRPSAPTPPTISKPNISKPVLSVSHPGTPPAMYGPAPVAPTPPKTSGNNNANCGQGQANNPNNNGQGCDDDAAAIAKYQADREQYLKDLGVHNEKVRQYHQVDKPAYDRALASYNNAKMIYDRDLKAYDSEMAAYNNAQSTYQSALSSYERDLASYNRIVAQHDTYNVDKASYEASLSQYNREQIIYEERMQRYRQQRRAYEAANTQYQVDKALYQRDKEAYDLEQRKELLRNRYAEQKRIYERDIASYNEAMRKYRADMTSYEEASRTYDQRMIQYRTDLNAYTSARDLYVRSNVSRMRSATDTIEYTYTSGNRMSFRIPLSITDEQPDPVYNENNRTWRVSSTGPITEDQIRALSTATAVQFSVTNNVLGSSRVRTLSSSEVAHLNRALTQLLEAK